MRYILLYIVFQFVFENSNILYCQTHCKKDSLFCYKNIKYSNIFPVQIEKKLESAANFYHNQTPLLIDVNNDCIPELLARSGNSNSIIVIDSQTGNILYQIFTPFLVTNQCSFLVADIDRNNNIEIIIATLDINGDETLNSKLICINLDGSVNWITDAKFDTYGNDEIRGTPSIADFNSDGIPEVYINNKIFNALNGKLLLDGSLNGIGSLNYPQTIAVDLDNNPNDLELAAGYTIYDLEINNLDGTIGNIITPINISINGEFLDGLTSIVDINGDLRNDVIVSYRGNPNNGFIYIYTLDSGLPKLLARSGSIGNSTLIGSATVGKDKVNGDNIIIVSYKDKLEAYNFDGTILLNKKWELATNESSGFVGSTIFDLNNDGNNELIYRDEKHLKIFDLSQAPPIIKDSIECNAPTGKENPILGDLDNTETSKVCVTCNNNFDVGGRLTIFGSPDSLPGWAPARGIWNQYNYHVLNINDDGTVPQYMKNNATYKNGKYNNFMVQESLLDSLGRYPQKATSLTGKINCVNYNTTTNLYEVDFDLNNRTDASLFATNNLPVSFYNGNPESGGELIGKYYTTDTIFSGSTLSNLTYTFTVDSISHLFLVVNTERDSLGSFKEHHFLQLECDYTDNFYQFALPPITKTTAAICNGESYNFYDDTLSTEGIYYHVTQNINGCDSVILALDLSLEDTISIITNLATCDTYIWNGNVYTQSGTYLDSKTTAAGCDSIATLNLTINKSSNFTTTAHTCDTFSWLGTIYDATGIYTFAAQTTAGCDSILKLELTVIPPDSTMLPIQEICRGDSLLFLGTWYKDGTNATIKLRNQYQCDSFITFELRVIDTIKTKEILNICQGDSIRIFDEWEREAGSYKKIFQSMKGCDSLSSIELMVNSVFVNSNTQNICLGDSAFIFNEWKKAAGIYSEKYQTINGCDSTVQMQLIVEPLLVNNDSILICEGDSILINGSIYNKEGSYQTILPSTVGCDTIYNFKIKYSPLLTKTENYSICEGDSIFINGDYISSAESIKYFIEEENCKTEITANITVKPTTLNPQQYILCPDESITINNIIINESTEINYTLQTAEGCDSVIQAKVTKLVWPEPPIVELNCDDNIYNASIDAEGWNIIWIGPSGTPTSTSSSTTISEGPVSVRVSNDNDCEKLFDVNITDLPDLTQLPSFNNQRIFEDDSINVSVELNSIEWDVKWSPNYAVSCDTCFESTISVDTNTTITLELKHLNGCTYIRTFEVIVEKEKINITIPNIINTNSSSSNSVWSVIIPDGYKMEETKVYDRWGNLVYVSKDNIAWDGKINEELATPGVFVYFILLKNFDGETQIIKGDLTVIH